MIDSSEKRNRQLAFELHNSHVCFLNIEVQAVGISKLNLEFQRS